MASEETFRSWPALQAAIAKDVQQRIEACQVEEPQLLSGPQIKPRKAAQHPGTQIASRVTLYFTEGLYVSHTGFSCLSNYALVHAYAVYGHTSSCVSVGLSKAFKLYHAMAWLKRLTM